jgi:hypothetical protein
MDLVAETRRHSHVVGDENESSARLLADRSHQVQDLRLHGDIEGRRRFVGNDQSGSARQGHRNHHPLPHASRELVRIKIEPTLRIGDAHLPKKLQGSLTGGPVAGSLVNDQGLGQLIPHGKERIQRGHRVLKNHRQPIATNSAPVRRTCP